ncbi:MAG: hypothetical protein H6819_09150 [Phycisphaerales bacterium]|nr:hypothetical protein [Phycisphaerales bacterium]MCB9856006.1 hypothetical protein [Phycisphaerales bacterium]MCB9864967.1 hypothetical protein [Phycisphaerales bacterium]
MKWMRWIVSMIAVAFAVLFAVGQFRTVEVHSEAFTLQVDRGLIQTSWLNGTAVAHEPAEFVVGPASGSVLSMPIVTRNEYMLDTPISEHVGGEWTTIALPHWATVFAMLLVTLMFGRTVRATAPRRCEACGTALDGRDSMFCPKCGFNVRDGAGSRDAG